MWTPDLSFPYRGTMASDESDPAQFDDAAREARFRQYVVPEINVMARVARSLTGNQADAEDVVQDTMLRAYRAIHRFDGRYPRAWLLTILRNANVNRTRRRRPQLLHDPDAAMRTLADESVDAGPEDAVLESVFDARVATALDELPPNFRTVVELVDLDGLSYEEAARTLDVPIGTVMSRLHRGRRRMRDRLIAEGVRPPSEETSP